MISVAGGGALRSLQSPGVTFTGSNVFHRMLSATARGQPKTLNDIVHLDYLKQQPVERIKDIWLEYYMNRTSDFGDVLTTEQYKTLMARGYDCPMMVCPVSRLGGSAFLTLVSQFQGRNVLFTWLEKYRVNPAAIPWFTVTLFDDFVNDDRRRLGLAWGHVEDIDQISKGDADTTWRALRKMYLNDAAYNELIVPFNKSPNNFHFEKLLRHMGIRK